MMQHNFRRYERKAVVVGLDTTVVEIADLMDQHSVGSVVVVDDAGGAVGIVTDRDLVRRVVAAGRNAEETKARDVMSSKLVTVDRSAAVPAMIEKMRVHGIRRLLVMDGARLVSVVSLDDLVFDLSTTLFNISEAMRRELCEACREAEIRRRRERREDALEELRAELASVAHEARERIHDQIAGLLAHARGSH